MTADELVEKVARAIVKCITDDERLWPHWQPEARAALRAVHEAMREPSAEMLDEFNSWATCCGYIPEGYAAMLAASPLAEAARDE